MPTPTYKLIDTTTLAAASPQVVFNSIPQGYRDLVLIENPTHESSPSGQSTTIRLNGDTGSNYHMVYMAGNISALSSQSGTGSPSTFLWSGRFNNANGNNAIAQFMDYSATDRHKTVLSRGSLGLAAGLATISFANRWTNTSAITSMVLFPEGGGNYAAGSTFSLYGIVA
jgi:hypothetical protein